MEEHFINFIVKNRIKLMGASMIMVLLFHMSCWPIPFYYLGFLKYGYFGVDVFILLSGFGLCFSFEKNKLSTFYFRRLKRLIPLYWVVVLLLLVFGHIFHYRQLSFIETLSHLSTLAYYGIGGNMTNWFIAAILLLYCLFPVIYKITCKYPYLTISISYLIALFSLYVFKINWRFDCLISRVPIFIFGIICYLNIKKSLKITPPIYWGLIIFIFSVSFNVSLFLATASICPVIICLLSTFPYPQLTTVSNYNILKEKANNLLTYCGHYSFALYTSNTITSWSIDYLSYVHFEWVHTYTIVPLYIALTFVYGYFLIKVSDWFDLLLK